jgi:hypothetical protein
MAEQGDEGYVIEGPDVAIVGWIPYAFDLDDMTENAFTRHRHRHAFGWLFDSGNPTPPDHFDGHQGFLEFLKSKQFRGACCLRDIKLRCDEAGVPRSVSYRREEYVGYTPYRWANKAARTKRTAHHGLGQKRGQTTLEQQSSVGIITQSLKFRVGAIGNLGAWFMTGSQAPWVWIEIEYRIDVKGSIKIQFKGSCIPSFRGYVNWSACGVHDMLEIDADEVETFLDTGRNESAEGVDVSLEWNGEGRRG